MRLEKLIPTITLLLTDGGISRISKNSLEIFLTTNSKELQEIFIKNLTENFGKIKFTIVPNGTVTKIRVCNKKIGEILLGLSNSFRTRACNTFPVCPKLKGEMKKLPCKKCKPINGFPPTKIPEVIMDGNQLQKRLALKIAMSADGGVEFHLVKQNGKIRWQRRLFLRCHNPNLKQQWKKLFEDCGFTITETDNEIRISGKEQLEKFKNEIGFVKGVKVVKSKFWNGLTKNELLEKAIKSFSR